METDQPSHYPDPPGPQLKTSPIFGGLTVSTEISQAAALYLQDCEVGLSLKTVAVYRAALDKLKAYAAAHQIQYLHTLAPDDLRAHLVAMQTAVGERPQAAGGYSANTIHQHFRGLRTFFKWCQREGLIHANPIDRVRAPAKPEPTVKHLRRFELPLLLTAAARSKNPVRDFAVVMLFLDTGIRREELTQLTPADMDLPGRMVTIRKGKMGRGRKIPLSGNCAHALRDWQDIRAGYPGMDGKPTFFGLGAMNTAQMVARAAARAGLEDVTPHMLRHTFATYYGGDIYDLQKILGHSDVNTTASIYVHRQMESLVTVHDERSPVGGLALTFPAKTLP
jgi:site-specific recombinase XerD